MDIEDFIILILIVLILLSILHNKNENFETLDSLNTNTDILSKWKLEGYKLLSFPNFYEVFGSNNLNKSFEFPGLNNWKLFTNTNLIEKEGLASLISTTNPPFYNFDENIRLTGFSNTKSIIGLMTPTKQKPSGLWLKGFEWYGVSNIGEDKNAREVIVWANHKQTTDIKINNQGLIEDAVKLLQFEVPINASLGGSIYFDIEQYNNFNHPPFTTFYFQILNNWGNKETVKVGAIVPYFDL
jgi:hypothetical protein